jgi:hypothetical protein
MRLLDAAIDVEGLLNQSLIRTRAGKFQVFRDNQIGLPGFLKAIDIH